LNFKTVNFELNGDACWFVLSLRRIRSGGEVNEKAPLHMIELSHKELGWF